MRTERTPNKPRVAAAIDLGSNMIRLVVGGRTGRGAAARIRLLQRQVAVARVAEGLAEQGALQPRPLARAAAALARFRRAAMRAGAESIEVVATAAFRQASNRSAALAALESASGLRVDVIDGAREAAAALAGIAAFAARPGARALAVLDVGGASTEAVFRRNGRTWVRSLPIGVVTLTEAVRAAGLPPRARLAELERRAAAALAPLRPPRALPPLAYAAGGAAVALAAHAAGASYLAFSGAGATPLDRRALARLFERFLRAPRSERARRIGIAPRHADLVPAGYFLLRELMARLGIERVLPTSAGVAEGILAKRLGALG